MTTIAYRDGVMAADRRMSINGWVQPHSIQKLFRMKNGSVCGITGEVSEAVAFIAWLNSDQAGARPSLGESARVVHLNHEGLLTVFGGSGSFELDCPFTAFGSGAPAAQAAMYMGADACKAVEIASLLDPNTGPHVDTMAPEHEKRQA